MEVSESWLQSTCVVWFKNSFPAYRKLYYMINNDGSKNVIRRSQDVGKGLTSGIPDTFLAVPRGAKHGLYVEFKVGKGSLSSDQQQVANLLMDQGYAFACVREVEEFKRVVCEYLGLSVEDLT